MINASRYRTNSDGIMDENYAKPSDPNSRIKRSNYQSSENESNHAAKIKLQKNSMTILNRKQHI